MKIPEPDPDDPLMFPATMFSKFLESIREARAIGHSKVTGKYLDDDAIDSKVAHPPTPTFCSSPAHFFARLRIRNLLLPTCCKREVFSPTCSVDSVRYWRPFVYRYDTNSNQIQSCAIVGIRGGHRFYLESGLLRHISRADSTV